MSDAISDKQRRTLAWLCGELDKPIPGDEELRCSFITGGIIKDLLFEKNEIERQRRLGLEKKNYKTDKHGNPKAGLWESMENHYSGSIEIDGKEYWLNLYPNTSDHEKSPHFDAILKKKLQAKQEAF